MEVFRICKKIYSNKLSASGTANRWNERGQHVIYAGSSRSLSSLELMVHSAAIVPTDSYKVMVISIADDDHLFELVRIKDLPKNWRTFDAYSALQWIGSNWYTSQSSLVLKVPSAVIPYEYNYMINTEHPDFKKKVRLVRTEPYFWDSRLTGLAK
jgi:RES domain-containing protein